MYSKNCDLLFLTANNFHIYTFVVAVLKNVKTCFLTSILLGTLAKDVLDLESSSFLSVRETSSSQADFDREACTRSASFDSSGTTFSGS